MPKKGYHTETQKATRDSNEGFPSQALGMTSVGAASSCDKPFVVFVSMPILLNLGDM